jgi:hypothetical protein
MSGTTAATLFDHQPLDRHCPSVQVLLCQSAVGLDTRPHLPGAHALAPAFLFLSTAQAAAARRRTVILKSRRSRRWVMHCMDMVVLTAAGLPQGPVLGK